MFVDDNSLFSQFDIKTFRKPSQSNNIFFLLFSLSLYREVVEGEIHSIKALNCRLNIDMQVKWYVKYFRRPDQDG